MARLREAENNVEIRNLKAQVGMLIEKSEKHTLSLRPHRRFLQISQVVRMRTSVSGVFSWREKLLRTSLAVNRIKDR